MAGAMERANRILKDTPWLPLQPLGGGGGGDVFLCTSRLLVGWFDAFEDRLLEHAYRQGPSHRGGSRPPTNAEVLIEHLVKGIRTGEALAAVKIPHEGDTHPQRFAREVAAMRDYPHPALIRLLNYDRSTPPQWFAMEAHLGGALGDATLRDKFLGQPLEILRAVRPIAEALRNIHAGGAVHRDVKPKNIFVADDGRLILGDLGVVIPAPDATKMTAPGGDPAHSPSWVPDWVQFGEERTYGTVVDVFALAKVIYFLLSGSNVMASQMYREGPRLLDRFSEAAGIGPLVGLLQKCIVARLDEVTIRDAQTLLREIDEILAASALNLKGHPVFSFLSTDQETDLALEQGLRLAPQRTLPAIDGLSAIPVHLAGRTEALVVRARLFGADDHVAIQIGLGGSVTSRWETRVSNSNRPGPWTDPIALHLSKPLEAGWHDLSVTGLGAAVLTGLTLIYG